MLVKLMEVCLVAWTKF